MARRLAGCCVLMGEASRLTDRRLAPAHLAGWDGKAGRNAVRMLVMNALPPGQYERSDFPRFGITKFAGRFPKETHTTQLKISGEVAHPLVLDNVLAGLPRVEQVSDFHCVTTWSKRGLRWGGVRFSDFYEHVLLPRAQPNPKATVFILGAQDGARTSLLLQDLLACDVLLADTLDGQPLGIEHGGPLRLVAPMQYGYKSMKHLSRLSLHVDDATFRPSAFRFMDHPRARVMLEERGRIAPGWLLRYLYRSLIGPTVRRFARAMAAHRKDSR
jgi:DMSO/TMAO reductase YedYZ molybdopterin-dependent catalytic subunit